MGLCSTPKVSAPRQSQEELGLQAAQARNLELQTKMFEQDKADRALLEPYVLKNMKLKKNVDAQGKAISYENLKALLNPDLPATRENLNPEYFSDENEKDAFMLSYMSLEREKKAVAGLLPVPESVEQNIKSQKENLMQNIYERYGKRYLESTGGSKGVLDFEKNVAGLREKIRTGKTLEASDISSGLMASYLRPQGYGYNLFQPNTSGFSNAMDPYLRQSQGEFYDRYMGGYIKASNRAAMYNLAGQVIGTAGAYYGGSRKPSGAAGTRYSGYSSGAYNAYPGTSYLRGY